MTSSSGATPTSLESIFIKLCLTSQCSYRSQVKKITKSMESEESHQIHGVWPRQTGVGRPSRVNILASDEYNNPMQKRGPSLAMANEPWSPPSTAGGHSIRPFTPGTDLQEWFQ